MLEKKRRDQCWQNKPPFIACGSQHYACECERRCIAFYSALYVLFLVECLQPGGNFVFVKLIILGPRVGFLADLPIDFFTCVSRNAASSALHDVTSQERQRVATVFVPYLMGGRLAGNQGPKRVPRLGLRGRVPSSHVVSSKW